jgi:hypothetical protein
MATGKIKRIPLLQGILVGMCVFLLGQGWAMEISSDKLRAYAEIYPDIFQSSTYGVSNHSLGRHSEVVSMLVESFNGRNNYEDLAAVLKPSDRTASSLRSENQIKQLLAMKGITWDEYLQMTHEIAQDPSQFEAFSKYLNPARVQHTLVAKAEEDLGFVQNIRSSDHQVIVRNLLLGSKLISVKK